MPLLWRGAAAGREEKGGVTMQDLMLSFLCLTIALTGMLISYGLSLIIKELRELNKTLNRNNNEEKYNRHRKMG